MNHYAFEYYIQIDNNQACFFFSGEIVAEKHYEKKSLSVNPHIHHYNYLYVSMFDNRKRLLAVFFSQFFLTIFLIQIILCKWWEHFHCCEIIQMLWLKSSKVWNWIWVKVIFLVVRFADEINLIGCIAAVCWVVYCYALSVTLM